MRTIETEIQKLFGPGTKQHSPAYKLGALSVLYEYITGKWFETECPYTRGTSDFDAYYAGVKRGIEHTLKQSDPPVLGEPAARLVENLKRGH